jgi:hypothetical protein
MNRLPGDISRSDQELIDQSAHVLWEFRQCALLGKHIYDRRRSGVAELVDAVDAAALEAFCVHARALGEFLWRDRDNPRRHPDDALAVDWFDSQAWRPEEEPEILRKLRDRTGWGVAHISFRRLRPKGAWGWDHGAIFHHIASRFALFADDVSPARVLPPVLEQADELNLGLREHKARTSPVFKAGLGDYSVATPGHIDSQP